LFIALGINELWERTEAGASFDFYQIIVKGIHFNAGGSDM